MLENIQILDVEEPMSDEEMVEVKAGVPDDGENFSFIGKKRQVTFNCVDAYVKEYHKDPDELREQKEFSEKYC